MKDKQGGKGKPGRKEQKLKKDGKSKDKRRAKQYAELAKKCCHPDKRSCKNCPLKGF